MTTPHSTIERAALWLVATAFLATACGTDTAKDSEPTCDEGKAANAANCVVEADYLADLTFVAQARPAGADHHAAVRQKLVDRLTELKFTVTEQSYGDGVNVIAELKGTTKPDEIVLIGAHYDSVPDCAGADDNGTGVAGALQAAAALARHSHERTLQIAFWDEEERGLVGSFHHVNQLVADKRAVVANFDFEMIGFKSKEAKSQQLPAGFDLIFTEAGKYLYGNDYTGDFIAVIYGVHSKAAASAFIAHAKTFGVVALPVELSQEFMDSSNFADLRRSDHASFWAEALPGMMVTDTANFRNTHYHCTEGADTVDRLDHAFAVGIVQATVAASVDLLKADGGPAHSGFVPTCDLDKQDCEAGKKCVPAAVEGRWVPTCMEVMKTTVAHHELCERPNNKLGEDNCAAGLFCTPWGVAQADPVARQCVKPCTTNSTCDKGDVCVTMGRRAYGSSNTPRRSGVCVRACDALANPCGKGLMCATGFLDMDTLKDQPTCMWDGEIKAGEACSPSVWGQCEPGHGCVHGPKGAAATCRPYCGDKVPCKSGTCVPYGYSNQAGLGHCFPS